MKNIIIMGQTGVGKTTLMKKLSIIFKEFNPAGFFTSDIIENGERTGIELQNINGEIKTVAHINFKAKQTIGKLKIDVKGFEEFIHNIITKEKKTGIYFFDEIGKLESESKKFSKSIMDLLNSDKPVVVSVPDKCTGLINEIKHREDVRVFMLTLQNHELKLKELTMAIRDLLME